MAIAAKLLCILFNSFDHQPSHLGSVLFCRERDLLAGLLAGYNPPEASKEAQETSTEVTYSLLPTYFIARIKPRGDFIFEFAVHKCILIMYI